MAKAGTNLDQVDSLRRNLPWYQQQGHIPWVMFGGKKLRRGGRAGLVNVMKYIPGVRFMPVIDEMRQFYQKEEDGGTMPGISDWLTRITAGSNPFLTSTSLLWDKYDPFYKKTLSDEERKEKLWQLWSPNFPLIPATYGSERIKRAEQKLSRLGRDDVESVGQATLASWFGIRDVDYTIQEMLTTAMSEAERQDLRTIQGRGNALESKYLKQINGARLHGDYEKMAQLINELQFKYKKIITRMAEIQEKQMSERDITNLKAFYEIH